MKITSQSLPNSKGPVKGGQGLPVSPRTLTCRKLMAIKMRLYELIPPVKTSFRSLCRRNCFNTKIK